MFCIPLIESKLCARFDLREAELPKTLEIFGREARARVWFQSMVSFQKVQSVGMGTWPRRPCGAVGHMAAAAMCRGGARGEASEEPRLPSLENGTIRGTAFAHKGEIDEKSTKNERKSTKP